MKTQNSITDGKKLAKKFFRIFLENREKFSYSDSNHIPQDQHPNALTNNYATI